MKAIEASVNDVWSNEELLIETLIRRIDECGRYSPHNPEWQSLSTMIDYALKTRLAEKEGASKILEKLSSIGYVPLNRISRSPSVRLGEVSLSPDGVIGLNIFEGLEADYSGSEPMYDYCVDVILTGTCNPIFTVFLNGNRNKLECSVSPDSKKLAILHGDDLTIWGLADCRILQNVCVSDTRGTNILWSGNSTKIAVYGGSCFTAIDADLGTKEKVCRLNLLRVDSIATNDDATEFVYCNDSYLYRSSKGDDNPEFLNEELEYATCQVIRAKGEFWALIDDSVYLVKDDHLEYQTDLDNSIDLTPRRLSEVLSDNMSDTNERDSRFGGDCEVEEHEGILVFKTLLGQGRTHFCFVSPSDLSYEKFVGGFEQSRRDPHHGVDGIEIAPGVSYRIEKQKKRASNFFLTVDGKEHPLGRCRGGAVAACAEGKIFVYRNRTIDVYDRESMKPITNILALDIDRWMVCGVDKKGVVSLVKMEDVESVSGKGSSLKVLFARLKAPDFKLDVFEGCFVDLDMVWNLRFSLDVRDNILFYYKRDGNRVKPLTLNRYMLKSGNMKRSSTMKADESKFEAKICELSDGRIAITSMDDMDGNLNVDPRITVRIMDINSGESNLCDISKKDESGHLDVSGIGETFVLSEDGHEYVVVQFTSNNVPLVCSRDSVSRVQFPSEGGYVRGTVVDHDGETCIVKDPDGGFSRYNAKLERIGDAAEPEETVKKAIMERSEVPLNKEIRTSFGSIMQNGGAFFCLRKQ